MDGITLSTILPKKISLENANVFFCDEFAEYVKGCGDKLIYCYDVDFIIVCRQEFADNYQLITFLSEPYHYNSDITLNTEDRFIDKVVYSISSKYNPDIIKITVSCHFRCYPRRISDVQIIPLGTYYIDLRTDSECIWRAMARSYKNQILRAKRDGIQIMAGVNFSDFMKVESETSERNRIQSRGEMYYRKEFEFLGSRVKMYLAYNSLMRIEAAVIVFFNHERCYYRHGFSINDMHIGAMKLLHWHIMCDMKNIGVKQYVLYGARINSEIKHHRDLKAFKERFGGEFSISYFFRILRTERSKYYVFSKNDIISEELSLWQNDSSWAGQIDFKP